MKVHLIGIGGIGMSALAHLSKDKNFVVTGSDIKKSQITSELEERGVQIDYSQSGRLIDQDTVCVFTTAVKDDNPDLLRAKLLSCKILHRSEFLNLLMAGKKTIMISGAHGKTTTTALLVDVFKQANLNPSYAVGGVLAKDRFASFTDGDYFIYEGDESDGSFLIGNPISAIFTNIDKEHLDYWKNFDHLLDAFKKAIDKVQDPNKVFVSYEDPYLKTLRKDIQLLGFDPSCKLYAQNIKITLSCTTFDVYHQKDFLGHFELGLFGEHYVKNALCVIALSLEFNIDLKEIQEAFRKFRGVKRRFEVLGKIESTALVDDYAHHPTEIKAVLAVVKKMVPQSRTLVVFQPHRFSRFEELLDEFIHVLSQDFTLLSLPVYAASEKPIDGVYEKFIAKVKPKKLIVCQLDQVVGLIENQLSNYDFVITLGAGNVTDIGRQILLNKVL